MLFRFRPLILAGSAIAAAGVTVVFFVRGPDWQTAVAGLVAAGLIVVAVRILALGERVHYRLADFDEYPRASSDAEGVEVSSNDLEGDPTTASDGWEDGPGADADRATSHSPDPPPPQPPTAPASPERSDNVTTGAINIIAPRRMWLGQTKDLRVRIVRGDLAQLYQATKSEQTLDDPIDVTPEMEVTVTSGQFDIKSDSNPRQPVDERGTEWIFWITSKAVGTHQLFVTAALVVEDSEGRMITKNEGAKDWTIRVRVGFWPRLWEAIAKKSVGWAVAAITAIGAAIWAVVSGWLVDVLKLLGSILGF